MSYILVRVIVKHDLQHRNHLTRRIHCIPSL